MKVKRRVMVSLIAGIMLLAACGSDGGQADTGGSRAQVPDVIKDAGREEETPGAGAEEKPDGEEDTKMREELFYIRVGGNTLTAAFEDNSSAEAFRELLRGKDVAVSMSDYGNFEKVGSLGTTLPRNDEQITTVPGDVILYQGNSITIYYDTNSWSFTRLGRIEGATKESMREFLGDGTIEAVFSLRE